MPNFAPISTHLPYWQKQTTPLFPNLVWNIPEQKAHHVTIVGGNSQSFSSVIRTSEYLTKTFPVRTVTTILPDSLRGKIPTFANVELTPSTTSGSFAKSAQLSALLSASDASILVGDFSKNSETAIALNSAISSSTESSNQPSLLTLTRDTIDLLSAEAAPLLNREKTFLIASMLQLQKLFRVIYYPRMILLSQPLIPILETLHKFTLTYPVTLTTFHQDQIIVAHSGEITTTPITNTNYSPLSLWSGQLATNITMFNLYTPNQPLAATTAALLYHPAR